MDIGVGEVDKYARLSISTGIDVEVVSSASDTTTNSFPVILEIHWEESDIALITSKEPDLFHHLFSLLYCWHKLFVTFSL